MSKRLQFVLPDAEMREIREIAAQKRMTVAEWVRQALRTACKNTPRGEANKKIKHIRAAARHNFPIADIDEMLDQA